MKWLSFSDGGGGNTPPPSLGSGGDSGGGSGGGGGCGFVKDGVAAEVKAKVSELRYRTDDNADYNIVLTAYCEKTV